MPQNPSHGLGGGETVGEIEGAAGNHPHRRSIAAALSQNMARQSARAAERDTLIEGLRGQPAPSAPPVRAAVFLRTDKRGCGQLMPLSLARTRLGRSWQADARIEDDAVSRLHAEVSVDGGHFIIADLGSANGTFVNERRVERVRLDDGNIVRLGSRVTLRFSVMEEDEKRALSYLHELGHYDPLTRVYNRRYLTQHLASELAFAERHHTALSLILIDIDRFKTVNDNHGHQAGDRVLEEVAALAAGQIRTEDVIARYGGEEFMIVLRGTPIIGAEVLAERVRRQVSQTAIEISGGPALHVTLSAGCASLECTGGVRVDELIRLADQRLYRAKGAGRNRVVGRLLGTR